MTHFPHDVDLGPRPDDHNQHRIIANAKDDPVLLTILHYLRDEAAECLGRSTDAMRSAQHDVGVMELGGHELLVQAFVHINNLRMRPVKPDNEQSG